MTVLRAANPVALDRVPPIDELPEALAALERIVATPPPGAFARPRRRRPARRRVLALVTAAVTVPAGAVAYALVTRGVTKGLTTACYATADVQQGHRTVVGTDGRNPLAVCAEAWQQGRVDGVAQPAPPLVGCVLDSGAVAVLPSRPGGPTCAQLGLGELPAATSTPTTALAPAPAPVGASGVPALRAALLEVYDRQACLPPADAVALARDEIDRLGLAGWTVFLTVEGPFPPDRPCAGLGFDEPARQVRISPLPPRR